MSKKNSEYKVEFCHELRALDYVSTDRQFYVANMVLERSWMEHPINESYILPKYKIRNLLKLSSFDAGELIRQSANRLPLIVPNLDIPGTDFFDIIGAGVNWAAFETNIIEFFENDHAKKFLNQIRQSSESCFEGSERDVLTLRLFENLQKWSHLPITRQSEVDLTAQGPLEEIMKCGRSVAFVLCSHQDSDAVSALFGNVLSVIDVPGPLLKEARQLVFALRETLGQGWLPRVASIFDQLQNRIKTKSATPILPKWPTPELMKEAINNHPVSAREGLVEAKLMEFGWHPGGSLSRRIRPSPGKNTIDGSIVVLKNVPSFSASSSQGIHFDGTTQDRLRATESFVSSFSNDAVLLGIRKAGTEDWQFLAKLPPSSMSVLRRCLSDCEWNFIGYDACASRTSEAAVLERLCELAEEPGQLASAAMQEVLSYQVTKLLKTGTLGKRGKRNLLEISERLSSNNLDLESMLDSLRSETSIGAAESSFAIHPLIRRILHQLILRISMPRASSDGAIARPQFIEESLSPLFESGPAREITRLSKRLESNKLHESFVKTHEACRKISPEQPDETLFAQQPQEDKINGLDSNEIWKTGDLKSLLSHLLETGTLSGLGILAVNKVLRIWAGKRVRFVVISPQDNIFPRRDLAGEYGRGVIRFGQAGTAKVYPRIFQAETPPDTEVSLKLDLTPLLEAASKAIFTSSSTPVSISWIGNKISQTNQLMSLLIQRLQYVRHFPLERTPQRVKEPGGTTSTLLPEMCGRLIVRCLKSTPEGKAALDEWTETVAKELADVCARSKADVFETPTYLTRDPEGIAAAAFDCAGKTLLRRKAESGTPDQNSNVRSGLRGNACFVYLNVTLVTRFMRLYFEDADSSRTFEYIDNIKPEYDSNSGSENESLEEAERAVHSLTETAADELVSRILNSPIYSECDSEKIIQSLQSHIEIVRASNRLRNKCDLAEQKVAEVKKALAEANEEPQGAT